MVGSASRARPHSCHLPSVGIRQGAGERRGITALCATSCGDELARQSGYGRQSDTRGRILYYDPRLSANQKISCNTCHPLDAYGAESKSVSTGFKNQQGKRNAPTVYNAAGHFVQFIRFDLSQKRAGQASPFPKLPTSEFRRETCGHHVGFVVPRESKERRGA